MLIVSQAEPSSQLCKELAEQLRTCVLASACCRRFLGAPAPYISLCRKPLVWTVGFLDAGGPGHLATLLDQWLGPELRYAATRRMLGA
jgi:hypothetical protein